MKRVYGTFEELGDYSSFCPLPGSVTINENEEVVSFDCGGVSMLDLEDAIEFVFTSKNGDTYTDGDMAYNF